MQLFSGRESDFFRNRLTHSLEVSQIAESIAFKLNHEHPYFRDQNIDPRLCLTAGLVHDIGHPPFGHNGEYALDAKMCEFGGFEGNAQTLRILSRLEKKRKRPATDGLSDLRVGLNLTYRTLAAALKYDREIDHVRSSNERLVKGYYADDCKIVVDLKDAVEPQWRDREKQFKTIECAIMDIADDIAYSTYDLEDSLKAGFLTPASILASDEELLDRVSKKVGRAINDPTFSGPDVLRVFLDIFAGLGEHTSDDGNGEAGLYNVIRTLRRSSNIAADGYLRSDFTAQLVGEFIDGVQVELDEDSPALSVVSLESSVHRRVETLKNYTYEATIFSSRYKVAEFRGFEVVSGIFDALSGEKGHLLMPEDVRRLYFEFEANATARMRVVCDFIAGMTDRYALEFYARLHSDAGQSIFKPL